MANEIDEQKKKRLIDTPGSVATPPLQAPATLDNPEVVDRTLLPISTPQPAQLVNPQAEPLNPEDKALSDYINMLKEQQRTSEEEMKKQRKRMQAQKARDMITSIGRGLSAMANLYHTTKGAPHGQAFDNSTMQQRYDRMMADYKANKDKIDNLRLQIGDLTYRGAVARYKRKQAERKQKLAEEKEAHRQTMAEAKNERDNAKADLYMRRQAGLITAQDLKNGILAVDSKYAEAEKQAKIKLMNAQTAKAYMSASGSGSSKYYGSLPDENGNEKAYKTKADYERAKAEGIADGRFDAGKSSSTTTTEKKTPLGNETHTRTTSRQTGVVVKKLKQSPGQAKRAQQQKSQQKKIPGLPTQN